MGIQSFGSKAIYPTKPRSVDLLQSAAQDTWYTLLDTTGKGVLSRVSLLCTEGSIYLEIKITIDGVAQTLDVTGGSAIYTRGIAARKTDSAMQSDTVFDWLSISYFYATLKIEVRHTKAGGALNIYASADYSIE